MLKGWWLPQPQIKNSWMQWNVFAIKFFIFIINSVSIDLFSVIKPSDSVDLNHKSSKQALQVWKYYAAHS